MANFGSVVGLALLVGASGCKPPPSTSPATGDDAAQRQAAPSSTTPATASTPSATPEVAEPPAAGPTFNVVDGKTQIVLPHARLVTVPSGARWLVLGTRPHTCADPAEMHDPANATVVFKGDVAKEVRVNLPDQSVLAARPVVELDVKGGRARGSVSFREESGIATVIGSGTFEAQVCPTPVPIEAPATER
jgi:hypothetical protein